MGDDRRVRTTYAHDAVLELDPDADERAPGAAVTAELCGSWDHPGPCPVAPHHTATHREGDELGVRVLFAVTPDRERAVRERVVAALSSGDLVGPDGARTRWRLVRHGAGTLQPDERGQADRLAAEP